MAKETKKAAVARIEALNTEIGSELSPYFPAYIADGVAVFGDGLLPVAQEEAQVAFEEAVAQSVAEVPEGACESFPRCDPTDAACCACAKDFPQAFSACLEAAQNIEANRRAAAQAAVGAQAQGAGTAARRGRQRGGEKTLTQIIDDLLERGGSIGNILTVLLDEQGKRGGARYKNYTGIIAHVRARALKGKAFIIGTEQFKGDFDFKKVAAKCTAGTYIKAA